MMRVCWSIKGYHIYRRRPTVGTELIVYPEVGNKHEKDAMIVKTVNDKIVGRVPANLCRVFALMLQAGYTDEVTCVYTEEVFSRKKKFTSYRRSRSGRMDREGGGMELACESTAEYNFEDRGNIQEIINKNIKNLDLEKINL
ncbi:uncharacterized protein LOC141901088 [Tubulanus polymorphus]|uniref:uncharacterized protein LOC141901088 n=1 Tax=Tubulanus polymorphus TaxID=672921 RepID=UPI003DA38F34